jgi:hypothetical protein
LLGILAVWSVVFLMVSSTITYYIPQSLVDARYQLHLAWLTGLAFCCAASAVPVGPRRVAMWIVTVVCVASLYQSIYEAPHRGARGVAAVLLRGHPRSWAYRHLVRYSTPEKLAKFMDASEPLLVAASAGRTYPLYLPDFTRKLYMVQSCGGPDPPTSMLPDLGEEMRRRTIEYVRTMRSLATRERKSSRERATAPCIDGYREALADAYGIRFLLSTAGRLDSVERNGQWQLLFHDRNPRRPELAVALYRRLPRGGAGRESNDPQTSAEPPAAGSAVQDRTSNAHRAVGAAAHST